MALAARTYVLPHVGQYKLTALHPEHLVQASHLRRSEAACDNGAGLIAAQSLDDAEAVYSPL